MKNITVIGGGAWGTALATAACRAKCSTKLYARETEIVDAINAGEGNPVFLPNVSLSKDIRATADLNDAVKDADALLIVVPAQFLRATAKALSDITPMHVPIVLAAKGIEQGTLALMSEIVEETMPQHSMAAISGPSFAAEVARGLPVALTLGYGWIGPPMGAYGFWAGLTVALMFVAVCVLSRLWWLRRHPDLILSLAHR